MAAIPLRRPAREEAPGLSAARAALADAITNKAERDRHRGRLEAALARLEEEFMTALRVRGVTEDALEKARAAEPQRLVARALGEEVAAAKSLNELQAELAAAEAQIAAAAEARDAVRREVDRLPRYDIAGDRVQQAAGAVLRLSPGVGELLGDLERLQRDLAEKGSALGFLVRAHALAGQPARGGDELDELDARAAAVWQRLCSPCTSWNGLLREVGQAEGHWRAALDALTRDAGAPLPG